MTTSCYFIGHLIWPSLLRGGGALSIISTMLWREKTWENLLKTSNAEKSPLIPQWLYMLSFTLIFLSVLICQCLVDWCLLHNTQLCLDISFINLLSNFLSDTFTCLRKLEILRISLEMLDTSLKMLGASLNMLDMSLKVLDASFKMLDASFKMLDSNLKIPDTTLFQAWKCLILAEKSLIEAWKCKPYTWKCFMHSWKCLIQAWKCLIQAWKYLLQAWPMLSLVFKVCSFYSDAKWSY